MPIEETEALVEKYLRILGGTEMRELDRRATEDMGVPGPVLMENAGAAVARAALALVASGFAAASRVLIVAGKGNNAGDGFVCARHLLAAGCRVKVALADPEAALRGDTALNLEILRRDGAWETIETTLEVCRLLAGKSPAGPPAPWGAAGPDLIIDAVLGTGLVGAPRGAVAEAIDLINRMAATQGCPVLAVDVPSGLDADTGAVSGPCVRATQTVTFACLKKGLVQYPGAGHAGRILVADIGFPPSVAGASPSPGSVAVLGPEEAAHLVPGRPAAGHKGTFGHVLSVAGSTEYAGAAWLCAAAALRAGAGLSTLASIPYVLSARGMFPEIIARPLFSMIKAGETGAFWDVAPYDALALGPGLGQSAEARQLVLQLLTEVLPSATLPAVLDADALNIVASAGGLEVLRRAATGDAVVPGGATSGAAVAAAAGGAAASRCGFVITPHPGELARLTGLSAAKVQSDRIGNALAAARLSQTVVCLKGARTVVASPTGAVRVIPFGNSGMATGGSGDVLTGIIAALLANGLEPFPAACAGAFVHAVAGDLAAVQISGSGDGAAAGLLARDILDRIPIALGRTRRGEVALQSIGRLS